MIESKIPCPPEVPGKNALIKASELCKGPLMIIGLPEISTVKSGILVF